MKISKAYLIMQKIMQKMNKSNLMYVVNKLNQIEKQLIEKNLFHLNAE